MSELDRVPKKLKTVAYWAWTTMMVGAVVGVVAVAIFR